MAATHEAYSLRSLAALGGQPQLARRGTEVVGSLEHRHDRRVFDRLAEASENNVITPIDVFLSDSGSPHAVTYFQYDWTVRDGTLITFKVMDYFTFEPGSDLVRSLDLMYDTHPILVSHGNKYESPL